MMWKLITKFIPFLGSLPSKLVLIVTLITTLTGFYMWDRSNTFEAGYNEAALQYETQMSNKVIEELTKAKTEWQVEADKAIAAAKKEIVVKETVRTVYKDVYRTQFICKDVGENALELLNRVFEGKVGDYEVN